MLNYSLEPIDDSACRLSFQQRHTGSFLDVPLPATDLRALMTELLGNPETREVGAHPVTVVATDLGFSIRTPQGRFNLPWRHIFGVIK